MNDNRSLFSFVLGLSVLLALTVIVLGAYTRLSDAGLGCPDWPGCYGHLSVPDKVTDATFQRPLETAKAWKEMIHRYVAGTLGILILVILIFVARKQTRYRQTIVVPLLLLGTVIFQALLGMWTVTLLLSPIIVTAHLLGGLTTLSLLWWLYLNQKPIHNELALNVTSGLKLMAFIGLLLVIAQIFLGGWTSSNYAALACGTDFPQCSGRWWPAMDFSNAFDIGHEQGTNYEYGVLDSPARTAIQVAHRIGALILFTYFTIFSWILIKKGNGLRFLGAVLILVLLLQVSLGIMNVMLGLPLLIAVSHNLGAALLLLTVIAINHRVFKAS